MSESKRLDLKRLSSPEVEVMAKERPYVLQMVQMQILYDMAGLLEAMAEDLSQFRAEFQSTIPEGKLEPAKLTVTEKVTELPRDRAMRMPWISFTLYNDGPDDVYLVVNEDYVTPKAKDAPLAATESLEVDMKAAKVRKVLLWCDAGKTAAVRIYAKR